MTAENIFTAEVRSDVRHAIKEAERITSGEIRVFADDKCKGEVLDRAALVFQKLGMHRTKDRNGVLIYLSVFDHKFAIIGDAGIHAKVPDDFWEKIKDAMKNYFEKGEFANGLTYGISEAGKALSEFFPRAKDDRNELPDHIEFGK